MSVKRKSFSADFKAKLILEVDNALKFPDNFLKIFISKNSI